MDGRIRRSPAMESSRAGGIGSFSAGPASLIEESNTRFSGPIDAQDPRLDYVPWKAR
jgi:hypothetical protein